MVIARAALQFVDGDRPQLWLASIGVAASIAWLAACSQMIGIQFVRGVAVGLALATVAHATLGIWGAVWRRDAWAYVLTAIQIGLLVAAHLGTRSGAAGRTTYGRLPTS